MMKKLFCVLPLEDYEIVYNKKLSFSLETILWLIVCKERPPQIVENQDSYICSFYPIKAGRVKKIDLPYMGTDKNGNYTVKLNDVLEKKQQMIKSAMVSCGDKCA